MKRGGSVKAPIQEVLYFCRSLRDFRDLISFSERFWLEEAKKYQAYITSDSDEFSDRFDHRCDLFYSLNDGYPQLQRQSYLVMLLSIFEDFLNQLCYSIESHHNIEKTLTDAKGKGIYRAKDYLTRFSIVKFPDGESEWENIDKAQSLRNLVVHAAGHVEKVHEKQKKIIDTNIHLDKEDFARTHLIIGSTYLLELIKDMELLCGRVIEQVE